MSALTNFCTFEVMDGVLVHSVNSEQPLHPAEHAISPLEPNFAWEANAANVQHQLVIDLTEQRSINGLMLIHHESEIINITIQYSNNGTSWTPIPNLDIYGGTSHLTHIHYLWNISTLQIQTISAQYWQITFSGPTAPNYYPPSDMRISACWLFTKHELEQRGVLPLSDQIAFPNNLQWLPFGKQYVTGQNVNQSRTFSRTWIVTDTQRTELWQIISKCGGAFRPFILLEGDLDQDGIPIRHLCQFNPSTITESLIDIGLTSITAQLTEIPIVKLDARH